MIQEIVNMSNNDFYITMSFVVSCGFVFKIGSKVADGVIEGLGCIIKTLTDKVGK